MASKTSSSRQVIALLVAIAAVGVLGTGLIVARAMLQSRAAERERLRAEARAMALAEPEHNPNSTLPTRATDGKPITKTASAPLPAKNAETIASSEPARLLAAQPHWLDVTKTKYVGVNRLRLSLTRVWLASDDSGAPVPVAPASGDATEPLHVADAKYVIVELRVTNGDGVNRVYTSWNALTNAVVLACGPTEVLSFIPPAETAGIIRLTKLYLEPGQSATDHLVFTAPHGPIERLRLVLTQRSLAASAQGHFAFEIPASALRPEAPPEPKQARTLAAPQASPPSDKFDPTVFDRGLKTWLKKAETDDKREPPEQQIDSSTQPATPQ